MRPVVNALAAAGVLHALELKTAGNVTVALTLCWAVGVLLGHAADRLGYALGRPTEKE